MARYYGKIGFDEQKELRPGVYEAEITERPYYGDVVRNTLKVREGEQVNADLTIGNSFSITADPYANQNYFAMRYIEWMGVRWTITEVEVQPPRLLIRVGGVYNGPTASASNNP